MKTRCKFRVQKVTTYAGPREDICLNAVHGDVGENLSFAVATPAGQLDITVTNPAVVGHIKPGEYYYLDLIPTEA